MLFTVELVSSHDSIFRFIKNGQWRAIENRKVAPSDIDFTFTDLREQKLYRQKGVKINLPDSREVIANPKDGIHLGEQNYHTEISLHRTSKPWQFTKEELRNEIARGDDDYANAVVITLDGFVRVVPFDLIDIHNDEYAVRHASYGAGMDYIGRDASRDNRHIDTLYQELLEGWYMHLATGEIGVFKDTSETDWSPEQILKAVEKLTAI